MKKIVGIVAAASLVAGLAFADGPTANVSVTDFTGNAQVQWGVDLDAGATGFKNSEYMKFVINLFDAGTKTTSSDNDVWAELEMKAGNTGWWAHRLFQYDKNIDFDGKDQNVNVGGGLGDDRISFDITAAKIHFGDFYIGIQNGDTVTGEYKFDGAIRSGDNDNGKWLENVGPAGYTQGIVAGYGNNNFGVDVDFRSAPDSSKNQYTNNYALAAELKLKESNEFAEGLFVDLGGSLNLSDKLVAAVADTTYGSQAAESKITYTVDGKAFENAKTIGYSFNAGYKLKIDDKFYFKPAAGLTGTFITASGLPNGVAGSATYNSNNLVFGAIFGWGATKDANAGVYYFDADDPTKKVTPGVSVIAKVPLARNYAWTVNGNASTSTINDKALAIIVPSFYTGGDLVEGLTAAVYSEIALLNANDVNGDKTTTTGTNTVEKKGAKNKADTFAFGLAAAVKYDIKADDITITPQAGFRFVNACYEDNGISSYAPNSGKKFFNNLGAQKTSTDTSKAAGSYDNGFFNLKAGVNVNGLINNTDLFFVYESANLMNGIDYNVDANKLADGSYKKWYNIKAGTLNVGCKISF